MSTPYVSWESSYYSIAKSTQDTLKAQYRDVPTMPEGTLIWTKNQTQGYGRHGRTWNHADDNLYLSFLIRPNIPISNIGHIAILAGLSVASAVDGFLPEQSKTTLKWPNDVLIGDKKCAGMLIEVLEQEHNKIAAMAIGIGINIHATPLKTATYLNKYLVQAIQPDEALSALCSCFSEFYESYTNHGFQDLRLKWIKKTYPQNTPITVKHPQSVIKGRFDTIDNNGNLIILCDRNERAVISSGDVFVQ